MNWKCIEAFNNVLINSMPIVLTFFCWRSGAYCIWMEKSHHNQNIFRMMPITHYRSCLFFFSFFCTCLRYVCFSGLGFFFFGFYYFVFILNINLFRLRSIDRAYTRIDAKIECNTQEKSVSNIKQWFDCECVRAFVCACVCVCNGKTHLNFERTKKNAKMFFLSFFSPSNVSKFKTQRSFLSTGMHSFQVLSCFFFFSEVTAWTRSGSSI